MAVFLGQTQSSLDLQLDGAIGKFHVSKQGEETKSLEVRYMLTHVSLDPRETADQRLLDNLAPVREVFQIKDLEFDEIMQRDIDDARVSLELIPYLLDPTNTGLIKLYPPIVAVVLPMEPMSRRPAQLYPRVSTSRSPLAGYEGHFVDTLTAGPPGREVFSLDQVSNADRTLKADGAKLRISTLNSSLAIVDGQHRAMALLALYRNLKGGWNELPRQPYKHYYEVWPESEIRKYDTRGIQLPVMICMFPALDEDYRGDFDVIRAARRIFLTLNKNARKVSDSRNRLMDDQDLASECLRSTLSDIKHANARSPTPLRIFNVELDQEYDRTVISSPLAITGVTHLYYLCERILFLGDRITAMSARGIRMASRRDLSVAFMRLKLQDRLTQTERNEARRNSYTDKVAATVTKRWAETYGPLIVRLLSEAHPLRCHEQAVLDYQALLEKTVMDAAVVSMLFEGQGTYRAFDRFSSQLGENIKTEQGWNTPEIRATQKSIGDLTAKRDSVIAEIKQRRADKYFEGVKAPLKNLIVRDGKISPEMKVFVDDIIEKVWSTVAFQTALIYTFIDMLEAAKLEESASLVDEYLESINRFFSPSKEESLRKLAAVFSGNLVETDGSLKIAPTNTTFRDVVFKAEMQPDEWPRYRYVLLELWQSKDQSLEAKIAEDVRALRLEVLEAGQLAEIKDFAVGQGRLDSTITPEERRTCEERALQKFLALVANFPRKWTAPAPATAAAPRAA